MVGVGECELQVRCVCISCRRMMVVSRVNEDFQEGTEDFQEGTAGFLGGTVEETEDFLGGTVEETEDFLEETEETEKIGGRGEAGGWGGFVGAEEGVGVEGEGGSVASESLKEEVEVIRGRGREE